MYKTIDELNLDDDFLFAKVMSDKEVCKKVIEKILGIQIKYIEMPTEQKVIDILLDSKAVRLDIYVNDDKGTIYNVEMQKGKRKNLAKRSRYYQGSIDLDWISKGEDYNQLKKSFVIFICTFDPFDKGRHIYTFENRCIEDPEIVLGDETTKVFLNTKGTLEDADKEMLEFLYYIEHTNNEVASQSTSELIKVLNEKVNTIKDDKSVEVEWMTLLERDREKFQEGVEQTKIEVAKALLDVLEDDIIAVKTGLPLEEIKRLRKQTEE